eukprot:CAMPEP_0194073176 /NCGR_PEP_ID=MMETSP0149-20130528/698_1 /TAXON_ID=122233 /ORGANISM="Chaetoceros debilis, Strain MM31A-1" /LENGTH=225 /DNA_ID=CAMNT_0038753151 /DNA_START=106 /DNA_END=779 /DNA_ORIENTATION=+
MISRYSNLFVIASLLAISSAFTIQTNTRSAVKNTSSEFQRRTTRTFTSNVVLKAAEVGSEIKTTQNSEESDDDDDWEYEDYETLTEADFYQSEWKVGTVMEGKDKIKETWCRLVVKDGEFIAVWGDSGDGKWNFDPNSQFLSISKESFGGWLGKKIWAGTLEDFYFMEGSVRGWGPLSSASVVGQWQAKRLGVDPDEAGTAPWFESVAEEDETNIAVSETTSDDA